MELCVVSPPVFQEEQFVGIASPAVGATEDTVAICKKRTLQEFLFIQQRPHQVVGAALVAEPRQKAAASAGRGGGQATWRSRPHTTLAALPPLQWAEGCGKRCISCTGKPAGFAQSSF